MTAVLAGRTVVVTRPAHQSAGIAGALRSLGARVVEFPAMRIESFEPDATRTPVVSDDFDWVIYTSANAVANAAGRVRKPTRAQVAAVGPATARALADAGIRVAAIPPDRPDSEALLALPAFAAPQGLRILILRGTGGRELLHRELERRGASVQVAELYRRVPVTPSPAALDALTESLAAPEAPVIVVTSVELLAALLGGIPAATAAALRAAPLVVPGPRVAAAARELNWRGPLIEAASAEDSAIVAALTGERRNAGSSKDA